MLEPENRDCFRKCYIVASLTCTPAALVARPDNG